MRKALAIIGAVLVLTGCERGSRPNPKKDSVIPRDAIVRVCVDPAFVLRYEDEACMNPDEAFKWLYLAYDPIYQRDLPAINERVTNPHARWVLPTSVNFISIPNKGAVWADASAAPSPS